MMVVRKEDIKEPVLGKLGEEIYEMMGRRPEIGGTINHSFVHVEIPPNRSSPARYQFESQSFVFDL